MKVNFPKRSKIKACSGGLVLYFIPLIIMGGRLAMRVVLNLWNMIER